MRRAMLVYKDLENKKSKPVKLFIRDGVVMNPKADEFIKANTETLTSIRLRRTGEKVRHLIYMGE